MGAPTEYNYADLYEAIADRIDDREVVVCGDTRLTYGELDRRANKLAHHLQSIGVGKDDHVGCHLVNGTEYVETVLACLKIRAVPVNVNYRYVEAELAYLYDDADLVAVVTSTDYLDRVIAVLPKTPKVRHVLVLGDADLSTVPVDAIDYEKALAAQDDSRDGFPERSGDDLYIIYTGGTTGMPKGVMWRQRDLFFAGLAGGNPGGDPATSPQEAVQRAVDGGGLVMFPVPPLMHGAAQLGTFISFWGGNRIVLLPKFDAEDVLRTVEKEKVNTINIVGDAMALPICAARRGPCADLDLSSMFVISSTAALLSPTTKVELKELFPNAMLIISYGSTETGFQGSMPDADAPGLVFTANADGRTAVLDENLKRIEAGSGVVGMVAQKRFVPVGYYKDPEKTAKTFVEIDGDRWVMTGDQGTVEADGTITVLGRGSVCINTGGEKVYCEEVEAALKAHPAVYDAVVTGVPDERFGERVAAVIQVAPGMPTPTRDDIEAHARTLLAGYKVPRRVVIVDEMQRSPSGKADYPWAKKVATAAGD
ncbi:MAG: 3-oxocholest-4-en-26-oate---CoA ligase [Frankiales bacterium]|jgi:acyl-CoA synthetase (AMP-forming)/AMP-acid ligase II|nr:3-oxocholest-4-en-26-oate---CoA ligase [Frankiales bacterium]